MTKHLEGLGAIVTGASSGIGEATALQLAESGAAVALVARRVDRLNLLAKRIEGAGGRAIVMEADVTDPTAAEQCVRSAAESFGRLDVVINNAGVMLLGPAVDAPIDEWRRMIDLNLSALLHLSHAALPHLLAAAEQPPRQVADIVQHLFGGRACRPLRQRRLQRDQMGSQRL